MPRKKCASSVGYFKSADRAREKQVSREVAQQALARGEISRAELSKANGFLDARDGAVPRWDLAPKAM